MTKTLQRKLRALRNDPSSSGAFILADAKESDWALAGLPQRICRSMERPDASFPYPSRKAYLNQIDELLEDSPLDLMVISPGLSAKLTLGGGPFDRSGVSPSVRFMPGESLPPPTSLLDSGPIPLFSLGFCRDADLDRSELDAYETFRRSGAASARHIMELFPACGCDGGPPARVGDILNDRLLHSILEVPPTVRPALLQAPYYGPRLMEQLAGCLPGVPVGILGGAPGTTFDAFQLLHESSRYGARGAVFGRRIAAAEHQPSFIRMMDYVARGEASPAEAVHAYHGVLQELRVAPRRDLSEDLLASSILLRGEESSSVCIVVPELPYGPGVEGGSEPSARSSEGQSLSSGISNPDSGIGAAESEPDFDRMTVQQKLDYNQRRRDRIFG